MQHTINNSRILVAAIIAVGFGTLLFFSQRIVSTSRKKDSTPPAEKKQNAPKPSEKPSENAIEPGKTQDRPAQHTQLAPKLAAPDLTFVFKPPVLAVDQPAPTAQDLHHKARREDAPAKGTKELMTEILANISCSSPPSPALFTSPRSIVEDHSSEQSAPADVLPERAEHKPHQVASEVADVRVKDPHANGEVMVEGLMGKKEEDRQANGCVVIPLVPSTSTAKKSSVVAESDLNWKAPEFVPLPAPASVPVTPTPSASGSSNPHGSAIKKIRCRFWPRCTNKNCKFVHPRNPCRNDGHCQFGDKCIYYHSTDPVPTNDGVVRARRRGRGDGNSEFSPSESVSGSLDVV